MIKIPGGNMFMGARDLPDQALAKPPHEVSVSEFCIDKTEVTTKAYFRVCPSTATTSGRSSR